MLATAVLALVLAPAVAAEPPAAPPTPDLTERKQRMIEAGVPAGTAEKVIELTREVEKLQRTPEPGSYRPEDLSPASRAELQPLVDRGVPMERAVEMLLLQERYQQTLKELSALPQSSRAPPDRPSAKSPLDARLLATAPGLGPSSFAILEDRTNHTQRIYRAGDTFQERTVAAIQWDRVVLASGNRNEILGIIDASLKAATAPSSPGIPRQSEMPFDSDIHPKSEIRFEVARAEVDQAMANMNQLFTQIRAVPHFQDGKAAGFRLFAIRRDSIFDRIGFKNGDIVSSINGNELADPTGAMDLIQKLRGERSVTVEVIRNRGPVVLRYEIAGSR